ncbi:hypothetical protein M409DRAFT_27804 [Zasmidium cellare ATCC 36951]|uniref:Cep57 centrosome microtubule-binding domain-containing protein n=1 Tax=Zasmidium cellare ATCC 36951 TaxID=1080233 RepID=A0A6A6C3M7_ZASCE|nr:uncharacterized protein M409DRAFT_27804 [Zasmidium cellare ATCC 36951]KAF2161747.1 hypothetical protein M409DRAFT_27804 [Zasmidium cellare ATCC 36951]
MAHSAAAAARTRLASSRASSPQDDNTFATATATSFKDAIHSTPQVGYDATEDDIPLHYNQFPEPSEAGSDGSADMSIELGRGIKRGARRDHDMSSELVFNFGNDNSQYKITGTPPVRPRKPDGTLRKEASVRRATESARANEAPKKGTPGQKQRAVSDNMHVRPGQSQPPPAMGTVRSSRFVSSRHASANYGVIPTRFTTNGGLESSQQTPRQQVQGNATVQSAVHTISQSFVLPDFPDITELVSGMRKDGTPLVKRTNGGRSRFASTTYKPLAQDHAAIEGIALPEDEKAIFVSLQHAREKTARLESENSEAQKRIEELELQVAEMKHQLQLASRRPDSALGSEDDTLDAAGFQTDKARLQGKVAALQERLSKSERKISVAEITSTRVVKERDGLVTQIAAVYFQNEELSSENQELRTARAELSKENEELKDTVNELRDENNRLKNMESEVERNQASGAQSKVEKRRQQEVNHLKRTRSTKKSEEPRTLVDGEVSREPNHRRQSSDHHDSTFVRDLATRIELEVRKMREDAASGTQPRNDARDQRTANGRSRSRSNTRRASLNENPVSLKRHISAPATTNANESRSTKEFDVPGGSRHTKIDGRMTVAQEDLTELSVLDPEDVANLRRKLEEEKRSGRLRKRTSSRVDMETDDTARSVSRQSMPRKSSLKDLAGGVEDGTGRFSLRGDDVSRVTKTVRVQSPHSSQDILEPQQDTETGSISMVSNTSRRRRRNSETEGMTSAFIVPDITLHGSQMPTTTGNACIDHNVARCTVCAKGEQEVSIPKPVPASDRDVGDVTDATIRPSQPPEEALAMVIKNLEDEIKHLKLQRESQNRLYNQHEPAISKRRRQDVKAKIDVLTAHIEKRSDQVYALYDVVEGQKQQAEAAMAKGEEVKGTTQQEIDETLESIGIDPVQLSGHVGRKAPVGLGDGDDLSEESVWEGLSDISSEDEVHGFGRK